MNDEQADGTRSESGSTLWHGRFEGGPDEALMAYTVSLPFDRRLWRDDIAGSRAHVRGLERVGLLEQLLRHHRRRPGPGSERPSLTVQRAIRIGIIGTAASIVALLVIGATGILRRRR